jgi:hypothetical protein
MLGVDESDWKHCDREILVTVSQQCKEGDCDKCKGILNRDRPVDKWIFCTHECHLARNRGV